MKKRGPKPIDLTDKIFGRLTAKSYINSQKWLCECECGNSKIVSGADLRRGKIQSCGCLWREKLKEGTKPITHGMAGSPEYRSWTAMIRRCSDPNDIGYKRYGGRGIKVCDEWIKSFERFYKDMGPRPKGTTLDRIEVDGDYESGNCRWADKFTQAANTSKVVLITANGRTMPVEAWARELGVCGYSIRYRIKKQWTHDEIINTPFEKRRARW